MQNKFRFNMFLAVRYLISKKNNNKIDIVFLAIFLGAALGNMVLIVVIGVMNGFQENHISRRIEVGSYHIVISKKDYKNFSLTESKEIKKRLYENINGISAVIPYSDREIIIKKATNSGINEQRILKLRALDEDEIIKDNAFFKYFDIETGKFDISNFSILVGEPIQEWLNMDLDEKLYITPDISMISYKSEGIPFYVSGFFRTGSYDYDMYWGFISLDSKILLTGKGDVENIGIKCKNRDEAKRIKIEIEKYLNDSELILKTDEEINETFFNTLKLEKNMIIFIFLMIFAVIATNIFGGMKLKIIEKRKDIAILKAVGITPYDVNSIFLLQSIITIFFAILVGLFLGCFVVNNILNIFLVTENVVNSVIDIINKCFDSFIFNHILIYDPSVYYQGAFLVKLDFIELSILSFSIFLLVLIGSYLPLTTISRLKPNEVLHN